MDGQIQYDFIEPAMTDFSYYRMAPLTREKRKTLEFVRMSAGPTCSDNCEIRTTLDVRLSKPLT